MTISRVERAEREAHLSAAALRAVRVVLPRLFVALGLVGIVYALATDPSRNFVSKDDTRPPVPRPAVAAAIPSDATVARLVGTRLLRVQDGLPDSRLFNSTLPVARDIRQYVLAGAWQTIWSSPDARTDVFVEVVARRESSTPPHFANDCTPTRRASWPAPVVRAGFTADRPTSAAFCALGLDRRTEVFVGVATSDKGVIPHVAGSVKALFGAVDAGLPMPKGPEARKYATPNARAKLEAGLLGAVIAVALIWMLPTLLLDRASWQRLAWVLSRLLPWRRRRRGPGIDVDRMVRGRLWTGAAVAVAQVCAAVWVLRLSDSLKWGTIRTALSVVAAVLAVPAVQRAVYLRRAPRSQAFSGRRRPMAALGLVLAVVVVAAALTLVFTAVTFSALGQGNSNPDYVQERMDTLIELLALPLVLVAALPLTVLRRFAMRALRTEALRDRRPPVLLLRSFADDKRRLRSRLSYRRSIVDRLGLRLWERFEEVVAASLNMHGPVLAVGQVGERLPPPLGAVRRQFSNEEWQTEVAALMAESSMICVTVGRSTALAWEIGRIVDQGHLHKTIFVFPPTSRAEHRKRLAVLGSLLRVPWAELDVTRTGGWALAVMVPRVGRAPLVVRARAQEDAGYDVALELCVDAIAGKRPDSIVPLPSTDPATGAGPAPEIYAPGQTPVYKPLLRRGRVIVALALSASGIVSLAFTFLLGANPDQTDSVRFRSGYSPTAIAIDRNRGTLYAVINYDLLGTVDPAHQREQGLARVSGVDDAVAGDGRVYLASDVRGTVEAYDADHKAVAWTLRGLPGVRGLVLRGDRLTFVVPATGEVQTVDTATGKTRAAVHLAGVPWADTVAGGKLYVSVFDRDEVVELDPTTLRRVSSARTRRGPDELAATGGTVWVYSAYTHTVAPLRGSRPLIYTRNQAPAIASNGTTLAIEGVEQVTTLGPDGIRRSRLISRTADCLLVTPGGDVIAAADRQLLLIRPRK